VQTTEGERVVVAVDWAELSAEGDSEPGSPEQLLDYRGLIQAVEMIERIRKEDRDPKEERETTCQSEEQDYDGKGQPQVERSSEEKS